MDSRGRSEVDAGKTIWGASWSIDLGSLQRVHLGWILLRAFGQRGFSASILLRASVQRGFSVLQKRNSVSQLDDAMIKKT